MSGILNDFSQKLVVEHFGVALFIRDVYVGSSLGFATEHWSFSLFFFFFLLFHPEKTLALLWVL